MAETKDTVKKANRPGFDDNGKPYPGVDPKTGARVTVTLAALKKEFGPKTGEEKYRQIAAVAGGGGAQISRPVEEHPRDISLVGADESVVSRVNEILSEKE